ncbi:TonB-dependent receptor domain-containing protein [Lutibacter maritimus]|uniref:TonB-dependent Receptor Plug Domain n=1 Tax=Lutibacter maritimus TaxID=593133 RepID=A0A1I6RLK2_9FLAO|nr:TonB-dependent receptor [Lutibacter maritimus]SFS65572.1 TonB-dependent Receptor Plug Domain [Lutibacter maritimus]
MKKLLSVLFALFIGSVMVAQTTISGSVKEAKTGEPIPGANIKVAGKSIGTTSDFDGNFSLKIAQNPPFSLEISLIGFSSKTVEVTKINQILNVLLDESATALDEVVVSASRTPERILESPVTIERMDVREIKNTSSPSFYDGLENLKGVDVNTNSFTFKSVNTRGFATFANTRFMQLVDGMDNSSPALNFNLGNLLGMSELDVSTVELLPGASSALYGANAFNGVLFMTSKNPFESAGISSYVKTGITSQKAAGDNQFVDAGIRMAYKFSDKFAAKASFSFLKGEEWHATDYNQYIDMGAGNPDTIISSIGNQTAFDQANIYGDEVNLAATSFKNLKGVGQYLESIGKIPAGSSAYLPEDNVSRTGYKESDLTDYNAQSAKVDIALHYKPFADDLEIIYNAKFGNGNTIYQGANRYAIDNFFMQQHKLEIRNKNFFLRGYITDEDAGDSYDMRFAGINMNKANASEWFGTYAGTYLQAITGQISGVSPGDSGVAHAVARQNADATITLQPGTPEFKAALKAVTSDPNLLTGAKFQDQTKLYHADANYNFTDVIDFAEIQLGGSWRQYSLNSSGTIFTDYDGPIDYNEYGAYTQVQKKFIDDRLKFTGSLRYDKAKNFDGNVSPRVSLSYSLGQGKTRNVRASFQTGFRNPTTQDQYIGLDAGQAILVGSAPDNLDRYTTNPLATSATAQMVGIPASVQLSGRAAYENAYTLTSLYAFGAAAAEGNVNPGLLKIANFDYVKPEKVTAYEIGYRAGFGKLSLDVSAYYNQYEDFIGNKTVVSPLYGKVDFSDIIPLPAQLGGPTPAALIAIANGDYQPFQVYTNSTADIASYGGSIGLASKMFGDYTVGLNYTFAKFDFDQSTDPDYEAGFNTPEHKVKFSIGNENLIENLGFNVNVRWNDEYLWESSFADAIIEAKTVVDAQVNYTVEKWKSVFKVGGANLGGKEYASAPGTGRIGSQYYISWTINP